MVQVIDECMADIAALIEADFGPTLAGSDLDHAFYSWLHYRARMIPMRPREIIFSDGLLARQAAYPAIGRIAALLRIGVDVSPWLSDRVRQRKEDAKADLMFNDWQVSHFHLGNVFDRPGRVKRGDPLLFAFISAALAVLLDVAPHDSWSTQKLLHILLKIDPCNMRGELPDVLLEPEWSDKQLACRSRGICRSSLPVSVITDLRP